MSANLVKYLHLHKNFNWHHLLNSKENSFSCLSRAIAASSRTSSFPKATPRAQEPPPHSRSIPQSHASCARTANTLTKHSPSTASCARTANTLTKHSPKPRLVRKNRQHTHEAFPKHRLVRKNRQHTHEAFPKHRLVRKNRQHTHEVFPKHRLVRKNRQHTHEADLLISQRPIC